MRLYLSSFRLGDHPEHLLALIDKPGAVGVIANAVDGAPSEVRVAGVQYEVDALASLGLVAEELDLRDYVDDHAAIETRLSAYPALWLRGGNAFVLRAAMARSGADRAIVELLRRDAVVYAGYSAGPCVLAPSLSGLELVDTPEDVREIYGIAPIYTGLGILDFAFVPHFESPGHPETEDIGKVAARYRRTGVPQRTLRDGQALMVNGGDPFLV
jgi:dipeptidase E